MADAAFDETVSQVLGAVAAVLVAAFVVDEFSGGGLRRLIASRWERVREQVAIEPDDAEPFDPEPSAADVSDVLDHATRITKGGIWP